MRAKQLRNETFIVREPESGSQRCIQRALNNAGLPMTELTVAMQINSHQAIRAAVEQGIGIAFLPRAIVQHELASGRLVAVPVADVQPRRNLYLLTDPKRIPTAAVRAFLALMQQSAETDEIDTTDQKGTGKV